MPCGPLRDSHRVIGLYLASGTQEEAFANLELSWGVLRTSIAHSAFPWNSHLNISGRVEVKLRTIIEAVAVLVGPFIVALPFPDPAEGIIAGGIYFFFSVVALSCLESSRREKIIDDYADYLEHGSKGPCPHPPKDILKALRDARRLTKDARKRRCYDPAIAVAERAMHQDPAREAELRAAVAGAVARRVGDND